MKMNVRLLRRIEKHVEKVPERFQMDGVIDRDTPGTSVWDDGIVYNIPKCGTVACIAGWACLLSKSREVDISEARDLLGLTDDQAHRLFIEADWPLAFQRRWGAAKTIKERVKVAVARIERFIETKGAE